MPDDLPPWAAVYQQAERWLNAGCFEALVDDLRVLLRLAADRKAEPSAAVLDSRTLRSTPESGTRSGYDGAKRKKGSKLHIGVDTLGHLPAAHVTPATADDRAEVGRLAKAVQAPTGESVGGLCRSSYTGEKPAQAAKEHAITLEVIKLPEAKRSFVLPPRQSVAERTFAWATRFGRLVKDYERLPQTLADLTSAPPGHFQSKGWLDWCLQQGHWTGGAVGANSLAMMARRTAGRLGDGGGPGTWGCIFPRPRPVLSGEAQVLQVSIGDAGHQGVPVQACPGPALEVA
jgi:transposase